MNESFALLIQFLNQIGGGPGEVENNLVRFGLPALFWAVLFLVAWSRRRNERLPRERLLLFGFGLFFARELFMFLHTAERMLRGPVSVERTVFIEPLEHVLAVSAILVICGAFMRYILDDEELPRRFLLLGFLATGAGLLVSILYWPAQHAANPDLHYHDTAGALIMHLTKAVFLLAAIVILVRHKGWVRNVVIVALSFLLGSVLLTLLTTFTGHSYSDILCPISNNLHIWAVPIFGFVYFREQSIAKKKAEDDLKVYRGDLEQLVVQRTAELSAANEQLRLEVAERMRAEDDAEEWAAGLSRLHDMSMQLNTTLEPHEVCRLIVRQAVSLLDCSAAGLFRLDEAKATLVGVASYHMEQGGVDGMRIPVSDTKLLRQFINGGEPLVIEDVQNDPRVAESLWQRYPMRALLGIAVRGTADLQGVLILVESSNTRRWREAEIELLANFADRAGVAWENAHLHKQLQWAAALEERQRIASEMHDGLAQTISTLALRNDQVVQLIESERKEEALDELADIQGIVAIAGGDLRRSISSLQTSPRPRCSLQDSIRELVSSSNGYKTPVRFETQIEKPLHLPPNRLDQIVHIVKEALINARRHACATQINVLLTGQAETYKIIVEDNGQGFDVQRMENMPGNHFGLAIMKARAERVRGYLVVASEAKQGTSVTLSWPMQVVGDGEQSESDAEAGKRRYQELIATQEVRQWPN